MLVSWTIILLMQHHDIMEHSSEEGNENLLIAPPQFYTEENNLQMPISNTGKESLLITQQYLSEYDPLKCNHMVNGHCRDMGGGAWSYTNNGGECMYDENVLRQNSFIMRRRR